MKLKYELNPPKIKMNGLFNLPLLIERMDRFLKRAELLDGLVDGIHLTDSVLGIPRVSGIVTAGHLSMNRKLDSLPVTCTLRIRDRSFLSICQFVADALIVGIKGIQLVAGDDSSNNAKYSVARPSETLLALRNMGYNKHIELDLAIPNYIDRSSLIQRKIDAKPNSFITQSIDSLETLRSIVDVSHRNKIKVIACIMIPCEKNEPSAKTIGLNWAGYKDTPIDFIKEAGRLADEVLLTSPNNFNAGIRLLEQLKK
jgi:5,10-methylenetetrahydrofolate reductase